MRSWREIISIFCICMISWEIACANEEESSNCSHELKRKINQLLQHHNSSSSFQSTAGRIDGMFVCDKSRNWLLLTRRACLSSGHGHFYAGRVFPYMMDGQFFLFPYMRSLMCWQSISLHEATFMLGVYFLT